MEAAFRAGAVGKRFLLANDSTMLLSEVGEMCRKLRPELPWPSSLDMVDAGDFGKRYHFDNSASKHELGLHYTPDAEVLERTLASMVDSGFVTPRRSKL